MRPALLATTVSLALLVLDPGPALCARMAHGASREDASLPSSASPPPTREQVPQPEEDEAAIRALVEQFYQAYGREDLAAIKSLWSAKVPGLERLMAAFEPTIKGKDFSFANVVVSRIDVKPPIASARVMLAATIVDSETPGTRTEKWVRNFTCVKDPEGWRVWRDGSAAEDVAIEIRSAASASQAAAIVEREPDLMGGELTQALFGLGNRLRMSGKPDDAREVYRLSEQVAERSGDPLVIGQSHTNAGINSQMVAHYDRALESFEKALALFEKTGDKARIAGAEGNIGSALYLKALYPDAIQHYEKALAYYEAVDHKAAMASTLHSIGNARYLANNLTAALESYRRSLALLEAMPGTALSAANALQAIGLVQKEQGDYDAALESYAGSLARHEQYGNKAGVGTVLASLGDVHRLMGSSAPALQCYFKALPLLEGTGDKVAVASTLADVANVYAAERRYPQALDYFAKSLSMFERTKSTAEIARVVAGSGAVHFAQGKYALAMEEYQRSLQLFEEIKSSAGIAWTLVHMGLVHQAESRFTEAHAAYEKSLAIVESLNDRASIGITLALMARVRDALDRSEEGLALAKRAAAVAGEIGDLDAFARARLVAGEISLKLGDAAFAREAFADAVGALERLQALGAGAERDRFFGDTLAPYLALVGLSVAGGKSEEALAWLERGKAYLLRNVIGGSGSLVTKGMTEAERAGERALARRLASLTTQLRREMGREAPDPARLDVLRADLEQARAERVAFTAALYEAHPDLKTLRAQAEPMAIDANTRLPLPAGTALVEFAVSEGKTHLFVVKPVRFLTGAAAGEAKGVRPSTGPGRAGTRDDAPGVAVEVHVLDVKAVDLAAKIAEFRALMAKKDSGVTAAARALYDLLLKPAEADLAGLARLVIVPDAVLWALPFQALQPRDGRYLIEDRAVSYAPSLAAFVEMTRRGERGPRQAARPPTLAAFGLAAIGKAATERLGQVRPDMKIEAAPEAPREAAAVAVLYGPSRGKAFVGDAATRERLESDAASRDMLHVAAPGVLNDSSPMTTLLAFAPAKGDDKDDALMETWELMGVDLRASVAFLSRLQGEAGQARAGTAAVGLAWALLVAGTPTTVLSSWVVDAPSTTSLVLGFHRRMGAGATPAGAGRSAADALRRATLALMASPKTRHPYYWAGFAVFGR